MTSCCPSWHLLDVRLIFVNFAAWNAEHDEVQLALKPQDKNTRNSGHRSTVDKEEYLLKVVHNHKARRWDRH